jgi:hypothetical protein
MQLDIQLNCIMQCHDNDDWNFSLSNLDLFVDEIHDEVRSLVGLQYQTLIFSTMSNGMPQAEDTYIHLTVSEWPCVSGRVVMLSIVKLDILDFL